MDDPAISGKPHLQTPGKLGLPPPLVRCIIPWGSNNRARPTKHILPGNFYVRKASHYPHPSHYPYHDPTRGIETLHDPPFGDGRPTRRPLAMLQRSKLEFPKQADPWGLNMRELASKKCFGEGFQYFLASPRSHKEIPPTPFNNTKAHLCLIDAVPNVMGTLPEW